MDQSLIVTNQKLSGRPRPLPNPILHIIIFAFIPTFPVVETEALNGKIISQP
jgi:hypothetical protein